MNTAHMASSQKLKATPVPPILPGGCSRPQGAWLLIKPQAAAAPSPSPLCTELHHSHTGLSRNSDSEVELGL